MAKPPICMQPCLKCGKMTRGWLSLCWQCSRSLDEHEKTLRSQSEEDREERIRLYQERAAKHQPLFRNEHRASKHQTT